MTPPIYRSLTIPQIAETRLAVRETKGKGWGAAMTYGFELFDKNTERVIEIAHGFASTESRAEAVEVARRRVLGQRPRRGRGINHSAVESWCDKIWGPRQ